MKGGECHSDARTFIPIVEQRYVKNNKVKNEILPN